LKQWKNEAGQRISLVSISLPIVAFLSYKNLLFNRSKQHFQVLKIQHMHI